jgi:uncharacterized protein YjhX (UPF0386 family)
MAQATKLSPIQARVLVALADGGRINCFLTGMGNSIRDVRILHMPNGSATGVRPDTLYRLQLGGLVERDPTSKFQRYRISEEGKALAETLRPSV